MWYFLMTMLILACIVNDCKYLYKKMYLGLSKRWWTERMPKQAILQTHIQKINICTGT